MLKFLCLTNFLTYFLQRFNATDDDIRRAYRKMVLQHHPDKRKAKGENVNSDDDYFTCITKAYEILGNSKNRRSYDSVDPEFDDSLPSSAEIDKDFYKIFDKYFTMNARWSERKNVPNIGDANSTREHVEEFYNFWYNFESWREYSYLDEEDKEKGQDREERRWIEKQNKVVRIKRKKEEMARIRSLVDLAYNNDPRIVQFKQEEKQKRLEAKRAKMDAAKAQKAEEERILKEAQLAKERAEQAEQKRIEQIRLEKEQQKRALKKERKILRDTAKSNNYYSTDDKEFLKHMEGVEKICEMLKLLELQNFNKELQEGGKTVFLRVLKETEDKLEQEKQSMISNKTTTVTNNASVKVIDKKALWNNENIKLLIKAVNLFPAGTAKRWEVIASFMNQHASGDDIKFNAPEVLNKAKDLQNSNFAKNFLKEQANESAFDYFEKSKKDLKKVDNAEISVKTDDISVKTTTTATSTNHIQNTPNQNSKSNNDLKTPSASNSSSTKSQQDITSSKPWTKEEQALLEQAIKTYPISTPDRWDRIAECIPNRTKKDCLRRVKELVDRVNAKKEAQQAVK